jgi:Aminoglycoside-2''-adenylyltransferase
MAVQLDLDDPIAVLLGAIEALRGAGLEAAVYGGLALAVYGEPRETRDADLVMVDLAGPQLAEALERAGIAATLAFDQIRFGGNLVSRVTLLGGDAVNTVDLVRSRSTGYNERAWSRAMEGELRGQIVRVLAPEDFVIFKLASTRERDLEDAATVLRRAGTEVDRAILADEVVALDAELPDAGIAARWRRLQSMG